MLSRSKSAQRRSVRKEFKEAVGIDGSPLKEYYNPSQSDFYNRFQLYQLRKTAKRGKVQWHLVLVSFLFTLFGFLRTQKWMITACFWAITLLGFWYMVGSECLSPQLRRGDLVFSILILLMGAMLWFQVGIFFRTVKDPVERAKLADRSLFLEMRLGTTLGTYVRFNIVSAFMLRALVDRGYAAVSGGNVASTVAWVRYSIENMYNLFFLSNLVSKAASEWGFNVRTFHGADVTAKRFVLCVLVINQLVALKSVRELWTLLKRSQPSPARSR